MPHPLLRPRHLLLLLGLCGLPACALSDGLVNLGEENNENGDPMNDGDMGGDTPDPGEDMPETLEGCSMVQCEEDELCLENTSGEAECFEGERLTNLELPSLDQVDAQYEITSHAETVFVTILAPSPQDTSSHDLKILEINPDTLSVQEHSYPARDFLGPLKPRLPETLRDAHFFTENSELHVVIAGERNSEPSLLYGKRASNSADKIQLNQLDLQVNSLGGGQADLSNWSYKNGFRPHIRGDANHLLMTFNGCLPMDDMDCATTVARINSREISPKRCSTSAHGAPRRTSSIELGTPPIRSAPSSRSSGWPRYLELQIYGGQLEHGVRRSENFSISSPNDFQAEQVLFFAPDTWSNNDFIFEESDCSSGEPPTFYTKAGGLSSRVLLWNEAFGDEDFALLTPIAGEQDMNANHPRGLLYVARSPKDGASGGRVRLHCFELDEHERTRLLDARPASKDDYDFSTPRFQAALAGSDSMEEGSALILIDANEGENILLTPKVDAYVLPDAPQTRWLGASAASAHGEFLVIGQSEPQELILLKPFD